MFENREILIITKHQKEKVIAPLFKKYFSTECFISNHFDTDKLGTFSGEIERKEDSITTLRQKCTLGLEYTNYDLAIASEGSFGTHPIIFFSPYSEEYMMLYDQKNNIEIIAKECTFQTNFNQKKIKTESELMDFAKKIGFPSHGLILKSATTIEKEIKNVRMLKKTFNQLCQDNETVLVETDMRAMYNPTRMKVIKKLTRKLIRKISSTCKNCNFPGFDIEEIKKGLSCEAYKLPTESTLAWIKRCKKCSYEEIKKFPNKKKYENPMYCNFCNP